MPKTKRAPARKRSLARRGRGELAVTKSSAGAIVSEVMPRAAARVARTRDEAIDADVSVVNHILWEASTGKTARLIDLYKSSRTRDSRLDAVCRTRVLAMRSRPLLFKPPTGLENDVEAKAKVELLTRIFDMVPGRGDLIGHLGHGALEGFAVAEHRWHEINHPTLAGHTVITSTPRWRHSNRFAWNTQTVELCRCDPGVDQFPGKPLSDWPGKFITHAPVIGDSDYPWYRGALRSRAIASVIKRLVMRWWLKGIERWGQPQVWASIDENLRDGVGDEVMEALRELSSAWHARFPKGTEVKAIDGAKMDGSVHDTWVQFHAKEDAIALLGQNLSTDVEGGSYAATKAHMLVRLDFLAADLAALAETILEQWVRPLFAYNGWPQELVPQVDFVLAPKGEITVAHYQAGLYTADEVRAAMGYDPDADGAGSRKSPAAAIPAGTALLPTPGAPVAGAAPAADAGLNGAQIDSLKSFANDVQAGLLPRDAAYELAVISFPGVDAAKLKSAFDKLVPGSQPAPTGGGAPPPFPQGARAATSPTTIPSLTSSRSRHPLATSLSRP